MYNKDDSYWDSPAGKEEHAVVKQLLINIIIAIISGISGYYLACWKITSGIIK